MKTYSKSCTITITLPSWKCLSIKSTHWTPLTRTLYDLLVFVKYYAYISYKGITYTTATLRDSLVNILVIYRQNDILKSEIAQLFETSFHTCQIFPTVYSITEKYPYSNRIISFCTSDKVYSPPSSHKCKADIYFQTHAR